CLDYIPNTYVFSKTLAEDIIQEYSLFFPCAIVRPSMVFPSLKEPFPGWIDNLYGPIGMCVITAKGLYRVHYCSKYGNEDIIPVDIVIKTILVVAWKLGLTTYNNRYKYTSITLFYYKRKNFLSLFRIKGRGGDK
ncbi:PREDICTED: fatty acyl-CoA reductase 1-like, partial [Wasmannia auropunctata]|uniref:fatty acyl-CoA reductase 1-like n=1 Tax=Wasmannia auropunctata TaxID=64793 RepID=UPI0005ED658B